MNPSMPQPMMTYPYGFATQPIAVGIPNQIQYNYPQMFYMNPHQIPAPQNPAQNYLNPLGINYPKTQAQIQANIQNQQNAENNQTKTELNSPNPMKILTKYKDIYVPTIFLLDYSNTSKPPFNLFIQNQTQQAQSTIPGQMINNFQNQNNQIFNKYFNYGFNFEQWKKYVSDIRSKFDELNELVKSKVIILPEPDNELEYLMAFPSDYGGLGDIQNDQKYENVKFYDPKDTTKNPENKDFMSMIKFEHETWFPLEPNPSSLNKNFNNDYFKNINPLVNLQKTFLTSQNPSTIASNLDNNKIGNNSNIIDTEKKRRVSEYLL